MTITRRTPSRDLPEFLRIEEAAAWLGIGRTAAYAWVQSGDLPTVRLGPKVLRVPREALLARLTASNEAGAR